MKYNKKVLITIPLIIKNVYEEKQAFNYYNNYNTYNPKPQKTFNENSIYSKKNNFVDFKRGDNYKKL